MARWISSAVAFNKKSKMSHIFSHRILNRIFFFFSNKIINDANQCDRAWVRGAYCVRVLEKSCKCDTLSANEMAKRFELLFIAQFQSFCRQVISYFSIFHLVRWTSSKKWYRRDKIIGSWEAKNAIPQFSLRKIFTIFFVFLTKSRLAKWCRWMSSMRWIFQSMLDRYSLQFKCFHFVWGRRMHRVHDFQEEQNKNPFSVLNRVSVWGVSVRSIQKCCDQRISNTEAYACAPPLCVLLNGIQNT